MAVVDKTKLTAVNRVLSAVGVAPALSLGVNRSTTIAEFELDTISQEVQSERQWIFNMDVKVEITPDGSDRIAVPTDALRITPWNKSDNLIERNGFMFDVDKNSNNEFTGPRNFNILRFLDVTELPNAARNYIIARASRVFQDRFQSSPKLTRTLLNDEGLAKAHLDSAESDGGWLANPLNNTTTGAGRVIRGRASVHSRT